MLKYACDVCEQEFETEKARAPERRKFCSVECRRRFYNKKSWEKVRPPDPEPRACVMCSTVFSPNRYRPHAECCSKECNATKQNLKRSEERAEKRQERFRRDACPECGVEFETDDARKLYCSSKCAGKVASRKYSRKLEAREKSRGARHKRRWGGAWLEAMERDGFRCRLCDSEESLNVHHLDGMGEHKEVSGDYWNHRTSVENCLTLCVACHRKMHSISLVCIEGDWMVSGEVFEALGLTGSITIQEGSAS